MKEDAFVDEQLKISPNLIQSFEDIEAMSIKMQETSKKIYEHRRIYCYLALLSCGLKRVSYLQVPPGGGKTWICLLAAKYLLDT